MKVYIGGKLYDSIKEPIMMIFDDVFQAQESSKRISEQAAREPFADQFNKEQVYFVRGPKGFNRGAFNDLRHEVDEIQKKAEK